VVGIAQPLSRDTGILEVISAAEETVTSVIGPALLLVTVTVAVTGAASQREPARQTQSSSWLNVIMRPSKGAAGSKIELVTMHQTECALTSNHSSLCQLASSAACKLLSPATVPFNEVPGCMALGCPAAQPHVTALAIYSIQKLLQRQLHFLCMIMYSRGENTHVSSNTGITHLLNYR
jgi:hypothetical protein